MKIRFHGILSAEGQVFSCITQHSFEVGGVLYEFGTEDGEYPEIMAETGGAVLSAKVENGELIAEVMRPYSEAEKDVWENPNYYPDGGYRGSRFEDVAEGDEV